MFPSPFVLSTETRQNRSFTQDVIPFLNNLVFQYTNPLPFETEPHTIHTIPVAREHCDSYLYYIQYKTLEILPSQKPFQVIFNSVKRIHTGTFYRTIYPQNITLPTQDVFLTYIQKLIEFNENQETPLYRPSHLEELKHKSENFEVPDLETKVQTHCNPHYWLQQDILQTKHFQYRFFNNITLTDDTIPQVKIFTQFLLKFFRFNYQLLWELQDQQAYINFPQILTETELLPYVIKDENKHLKYRDPTSLNITFFQQINLDNNCITEYFETSDNRPYLTSHIPPEITPEEQTLNVIPQYTRQHSVQSEEEQEDLDNPLYPQLTQTPDTQQINPSETVTLQNTSESSEASEQTVQNTQSFTTTNDSNLIQVPIHNINPDQTHDQNQNTTFTLIQDNTSLLSTSNTKITQPSQVQPSPRQNYDPPSIPPQFATQTHTHNSPQQGSSHTLHTNTVHFQTPTPPSPHEIQTSTYTPAQNDPVQNVQPSLNINTIH